MELSIRTRLTMALVAVVVASGWAWWRDHNAQLVRQGVLKEQLRVADSTRAVDSLRVVASERAADDARRKAVAASGQLAAASNGWTAARDIAAELRQQIASGALPDVKPPSATPAGDGPPAAASVALLDSLAFLTAYVQRLTTAGNALDRACHAVDATCAVERARNDSLRLAFSAQVATLRRQTALDIAAARAQPGGGRRALATAAWATAAAAAGYAAGRYHQQRIDDRGVADAAPPTQADALATWTLPGARMRPATARATLRLGLALF
jgi:hypothetical protein